MLNVQGCHWEIKIYPFSKVTLFSDQKYPKIYENLGIYPVEYYPSLNGPFSLENLSPQCLCMLHSEFFYWYALSTRLEQTLNFPENAYMYLQLKPI